MDPGFRIQPLCMKSMVMSQMEVRTALGSSAPLVRLMQKASYSPEDHIPASIIITDVNKISCVCRVSRRGDIT